MNGGMGQTFQGLKKFSDAANGNLSTFQILCGSRTVVNEGRILRDVLLTFDDEMMILSIGRMNTELDSANCANGPFIRPRALSYQTPHPKTG
jgi:hypothetical protein